MKKRILSLALVLAMALSLFPATAIAADTAAQQNDIGGVYPTTFTEYKGYYYALWSLNGAITRHKADGTENKVLFSYGGIDDLNTLSRGDYLTEETIKDSFTNMVIYQDKIYVAVSKNDYSKEAKVKQYAAIYSMNLDGTDWKQVVKASDDVSMGTGSAPKTKTWCIWNDRIYYSHSVASYSVNLTGGDKQQITWKTYSDKSDATGAGPVAYYHGDYAYLSMKYRSYSVSGQEKETEFRLYRVNLNDGKVTQYKTLNFKASIGFVADGWVYITNNSNEWWRVKADGSQASGEYLGNNISKLTTFGGDLYYIEASSKTAYKSAGMGKISPTLALSKPGFAKSLTISGSYIMIDSERQTTLTDLAGSQETFSLAYMDEQNYMNSSLVAKNLGYVYRPTFKGTAAPEGMVTPPKSVSDTYFAAGNIQNGWYNFKCRYKYINIDSNGNAELRFDSPTTAYYIERQGNQVYTIKTRAGKYLAISGTPKNGSIVTTSDTPYQWHMRGFGLMDGFLLSPADNKGFAANASEAKFIDGTDFILWTAPKTSLEDNVNHFVLQLLPVDANGVEQPRYSIKMSDWAASSLAKYKDSPFPEFGDDYTKPLTRVQMAKALMIMTYNLTQQNEKYLPGVIPEAQVPQFSDTADRGVWYLTYWGITSGVGDNKFNPQGLVTREQMASFLVRTMNYYDTKIYTDSHPSRTKGNVNQFQDAKKISGWAKDAVAEMVGSGYMSGSDGKVDPTGNCTIEQALVLCNRIEESYRKINAGGGEAYQEGISKNWYVDGNFTIACKMGGNLTINSEGKGVISHKQSQVFTRKFKGDGRFTLQTADGKYLAISGTKEDGKPLIVQNEEYLWGLSSDYGASTGAIIKPLSNNTQYVLNVSGFDKSEGAPVIIYTSKVGTLAQLSNYWAEDNEVFIFKRVQ